MSQNDQLQRILDRRMCAILRADSADQLEGVAGALLDGGIDVVEVTFTVPGALDLIKRWRREFGERMLLGAGSVLDPETARAALLAGAQFLVSPTLNLDVIRLARRYGKVVIPGTFTPTEVVTAWEAGADVVKVFPANVGGPGYVKALRGPLPQVRLMPTGGVNLETLRDFMEAGSCAVGLGSALVEKRAVADGDLDRIRDLARRYVDLMQAIRAESGG